MSLLRTYPYLFANIPVLILMLSVLWSAKPRNYRKISMMSGLTCLPGAFTALLHNTSYWNPVRLGGSSLGIEDFMFTFITGVMVILLAVFPYRFRIKWDNNFTGWIKRFLFCAVLFLGLSIIFWLIGVKSLENTLISGVAAIGIILILKPKIYYFAANGILFFTPIYIFIVKIQFLIWPNYLTHWNPESFLGIKIIGLPLGEFIFAAVFGSCWPIYIAYVFGIELFNRVDSTIPSK